MVLKIYFIWFCIVIQSIGSSINEEVRNQGENVTFLCQTVGEPVPDIIWYFNNDVMLNVSDSKYIIHSRTVNVSIAENALTIYDVTSSDVGTYTCISSNEIGDVSSFGILTVTSEFIYIHIEYIYMHVYIYICTCMYLI